MSKKKFYTAMNEAVFYYCIGNDKERAKIFIEQVTKKKIYKIEMKNPKLLKDYMNTKEKILDYLVLTDEGYVNIEINNYNELWRINRDVTYACKVLSNSVNKKENYNNAKKVTQININRLGKKVGGIEAYKFNSMYNEKGFPKTLTDIIEIYIINIDYFKEMVYNGNKKFIMDNYILCSLDLEPNDINKVIDSIPEGDEKLMGFKKDLEKINDDEDFVNWISAEEEAEMIQRTRISIAEEAAIKRGMEKGLKKGFKQGIEQGTKQGVEQGIEQGIQKGIEQGTKQALIETAKSMKEENIDINLINKITKLSIEQINEL